MVFWTIGQYSMHVHLIHMYMYKYLYMFVDCRFAFALMNGIVGVYAGEQRLWRSKVTGNISCHSHHAYICTCAVYLNELYLEIIEWAVKSIEN